MVIADESGAGIVVLGLFLMGTVIAVVGGALWSFITVWRTRNDKKNLNRKPAIIAVIILGSISLYWLVGWILATLGF